MRGNEGRVGKSTLPFLLPVFIPKALIQEPKICLKYHYLKLNGIVEIPTGELNEIQIDCGFVIVDRTKQPFFCLHYYRSQSRTCNSVWKNCLLNSSLSINFRHIHYID